MSLRDDVASALDGIEDAEVYSGRIDRLTTWSSEHLADAILAALPGAEEAYELGRAWQRAEAALRSGETIDLVLESHVDGGRYLAWTMRRGVVIPRHGPTPAAALLALADKLERARDG